MPGACVRRLPLGTATSAASWSHETVDPSCAVGRGRMARTAARPMAARSRQRASAGAAAVAPGDADPARSGRRGRRRLAAGPAERPDDRGPQHNHRGDGGQGHERPPPALLPRDGPGAQRPVRRGGRPLEVVLREQQRSPGGGSAPGARRACRSGSGCRRRPSGRLPRPRSPASRHAGPRHARWPRPSRRSRTGDCIVVVRATPSRSAIPATALRWASTVRASAISVSAVSNCQLRSASRIARGSCQPSASASVRPYDARACARASSNAASSGRTTHSRQSGTRSWPERASSRSSSARQSGGPTDALRGRDTHGRPAAGIGVQRRLVGTRPGGGVGPDLRQHVRRPPGRPAPSRAPATPRTRTRRRRSSSPGRRSGPTR